MRCRQVPALLLACLLVGQWDFAGTVYAPQFGKGVNETLKVFLCQHAGGPRFDGDEQPLRPSVGVRVERALTLDDREIQIQPEYFCYVDGKLLKEQWQTWKCPELRSDEYSRMRRQPPGSFMGGGGP